MHHALTGLALLAIAGCASIANAAEASSCSARSPAHTVALVELFTSEGCSSCPPADSFLAARRGAGLRADQAVLLSLHVDYWNDIGWKDPYSSAAFTARQRWLSDLARTRTIYTPEFFVSGKELRNWGGGLDAKVKSINAMPARAAIAMTLSPTPAGTAALPVEVRASGPAGSKLYVALVESGIASQVKSGENGGRLLRHDYVVRAWPAPVELGLDGKASLSRALALPAGAQPGKLGVAAFVQSPACEVLQALSLDACKS